VSEEEEEEEEEGLFKANAVNEEDPERDRARGLRGRAPGFYSGISASQSLTRALLHR